LYDMFGKSLSVAHVAGRAAKMTGAMEHPFKECYLFSLKLIALTFYVFGGQQQFSNKMLTI
jgi:hypothetical protein